MATATTTSTTTAMSNSTYKTVDENGKVTYSDTPSTTAKGGQQGEDAAVESNKTKGVVRTREVVKDKKTGKTIVIERDADGNITPESKKALEPNNKKSAEELLKQEAKRQAVIDKINAEKAAEAANEAKRIGVNVGIEVTLPNGKKIIDKKVSAGHEKTDTSVSTETDIGGKIKKAAGKEDVPTPGVSITGGLVISAKGLKTLGMSPKQIEIAQDIDKNKEEHDADVERAKKKRDETLIEAVKRKDPKLLQKANDEYLADRAEIARKWSNKAGDATIK